MAVTRLWRSWSHWPWNSSTRWWLPTQPSTLPSLTSASVTSRARLPPTAQRAPSRLSSPRARLLAERRCTQHRARYSLSEHRDSIGSPGCLRKKAFMLVEVAAFLCEPIATFLRKKGLRIISSCEAIIFLRDNYHKIISFTLFCCCFFFKYFWEKKIKWNVKLRSFVKVLCYSIKNHVIIFTWMRLVH